MRHILIGGLAASALVIGQAHAEDSTLKVGTVAGPETEVMQVAADIAERDHGLDIEITEFTDYVTPNAALADGSLDANAYQHEPYMQSMVEDRGYDFAIAGRTFVYPIGAYSEQYDSIAALPDGATIALPNDPSNEGRSLILMHNEGLITLDDPSNLEATPLNIVENPHDFEFREIEAAQLPRVLPDVDMAFINNTFAQPAGLTLDDALIKEGPESPYVNIIAVRGGDEDKETIQQLVDAYQSDAVEAKAEELFGAQAVPGWK
ncbi:MetQ/NlpA family ABC transporter substrate-binding protein [Halomonas sp. 18H]|uniref:MetQ/NlpA family ABC transporter substrate-binding protein n=1 Tax=Halomonas almeriensis TaxID=308163 RepID=UPI00222F3D8B|nr:MULTISPECIES: MetQ/NlpA family ABC transporter substrate-binding protein [Halomonas]MCW4151167.1 MetQ/NlpA family ABC transporter substrate-binding protein [Halomonas sp. 18H]MDN3553047.1 MetQ/NlpA family ABC transporter substrate-binding protein [Halomonas almeriensis]